MSWICYDCWDARLKQKGVVNLGMNKEILEQKLTLIHIV
jgi:hypothetical protein